MKNVTKDLLKKEKIVSLLGKEEVTTFGVDQGYANLGYSVIKYNILSENVKILYVKGLSTSPSKPLNKRIEFIYDEIENLLTGDFFNDINLDAIGCEKLFHNVPMKVNSNTDFAKNTMIKRNKSASIMKTNMVTGLLYLLSGKLDKPIFEYAPTTVKKHITGNGRATKIELTNAIDTIINECGVIVKTDHQSDSIGIAITTAKDFCENVYKEHLSEDKTITTQKKSKKKKNKEENKIE